MEEILDLFIFPRGMEAKKGREPCCCCKSPEESIVMELIEESKEVSLQRVAAVIQPWFAKKRNKLLFPAASSLKAELRLESFCINFIVISFLTSCKFWASPKSVQVCQHFFLVHRSSAPHPHQYSLTLLDAGLSNLEKEGTVLKTRMHFTQRSGTTLTALADKTWAAFK